MDNKDSYSPQECNVSVNGSFAAESGAGRYEKGATVAISAGIREGYVFSGWKTTAFGLTLDNTNSPDATFTMPTGNVTITANWTRVATYNVSVNNSYADGSGAGKYVQGATVTISAG
ncbi:MAG: hypothetical protein FWG53_01940, partial [Clostridiales bacterium]|nr:hypothetical protein [Clostridiales bacterium]